MPHQFYHFHPNPYFQLIMDRLDSHVDLILCQISSICHLDVYFDFEEDKIIM